MSFFSSCFSCCFPGSAENEKADTSAASAAAAARHARIVSTYTAETNSVLATPPPSYADIAYDRPVVLSDSKRQAPEPETETETSLPSSSSLSPSTKIADEYEHEDYHYIQQPADVVRRSSVSSRSSVVSVPSTRLSDLTSMYTGATQRSRYQHRGGEADNQSETNGGPPSWRSSRWYGSDFGDDGVAPPSYYAGSTRSVSPVPTPTMPASLTASVVGIPPPPAALAMQHPVMQEGWFDGLRFDAERETNPYLQTSSCARQR